jgi:hypothetical protein
MRCWYTRWQMSSALDRGDLASRMGRGHAAGCAACQAFGHALEALDARLSRGAPAAPVPVVVTPRAPRARWPLLVAGPLAAAAAITIVVGTRGTPVGPVIDDRGTPVVVRVDEPLAPVHRVADRVSQVFANTPLETELDALIHDGRRGLDAVLATGGLR